MRQGSQEFLAPQFWAALRREGIQKDQIEVNMLRNLPEHQTGVSPELDPLAVGLLPTVGLLPAVDLLPAALVADRFKFGQHRG